MERYSLPFIESRLLVFTMASNNRIIRFLVLSLSLCFGTIWAQTKYFIAPSVRIQTSFNSSNFNRWNTELPKTPPSYEYSYKHINLSSPLRFGVDFGLKWKDKHQVEFGIHTDGTSEHEKVLIYSYSPYDSTLISDFIGHKARTVHMNYNLNYQYYFVKKPNKTNLSLGVQLSYLVRAGTKKVESVGSFGFSDMPISSNSLISFTTSGFTSPSKSAISFGVSMNSELFYNSHYWFDIGLNFNYSKRYLYMSRSDISISNITTNEVSKYSYSHFQHLTNINLSVSRKFNLQRKK